MHKKHRNMSQRSGISDLWVSALFLDAVSICWGGKGRGAMKDDFAVLTALKNRLLPAVPQIIQATKAVQKTRL